MPSARIVTSRSGYEAISPEGKAEIEQTLQRMIAEGMGDSIIVLMVEVLWLPFERGANEVAFSVEIIFSVTENTNPPREQLEEMAERIRQWLRRTPLTAGFKDVAVWVRPQPGAVFRIAEK